MHAIEINCHSAQPAHLFLSTYPVTSVDRLDTQKFATEPTEALHALSRLGYQGKGDITVISDGEDCLKRLRTALPQPATHILDWFHIAMKLRPLEQTAAWLSRHNQPNSPPDLAANIASLKWRLWNGQADRALDLINGLLRNEESAHRDSVMSRQLLNGMKNVTTYIRQNRKSIANYGERYRDGKRISSTSAEASVNNLVARRMVKKQQMRWSEQGANLLALSQTFEYPDGQLMLLDTSRETSARVERNGN